MSGSQPGLNFQWHSQPVFVLVAAGATLSLNDFMTLPVLIGQNGGGAFLLLYVIFLFAMGMPLLMAEIMLGRLGKADPSKTIETLSRQHKLPSYWKHFGLASMLAAFLIIAMFSVIAGWSLSYFIKSFLGVFSGMSAEAVGESFKSFVGDAERMMLWHTLFIILFISISAQKIKFGFEKVMLAVVLLVIFILILGLILASRSPEFVRSAEYLLVIDFNHVNSNVALLALYRAFYTLALGIGVMMMFGSYLPNHVSISRSAGLIIVIDLLISIIISLGLNTLFFESGMEPPTEDQFAFRVLPYVFSQFQYGALLGGLFFLLLTLVSLIATLSLLEAPIRYIQRKFDIKRSKAAIYMGISVWIFGIGGVLLYLQGLSMQSNVRIFDIGGILSYSVWNGDGFTAALFWGDSGLKLFDNAGFDDVIAFFSSHLIQPLVALFLCIFAGWMLPRSVTFKALHLSQRLWFELWNYSIRYIALALIFIVTLNGLGII